jgi:hypothetical protein
MSKISERLAEALQRFAIEEEKVEKGNHSASVRARKILMEIKNIAADGRVAIHEQRNNAPKEEAAAA